MEIRWDALRAFALGFNTMLPALKAISLGYFSLGQQRKVTRAAAAVRNARCVNGQIAATHGRRQHENNIAQYPAPTN